MYLTFLQMQIWIPKHLTHTSRPSLISFFPGLNWEIKKKRNLQYLEWDHTIYPGRTQYSSCNKTFLKKETHLRSVVCVSQKPTCRNIQLLLFMFTAFLNEASVWTGRVSYTLSGHLTVRVSDPLTLRGLMLFPLPALFFFLFFGLLSQDRRWNHICRCSGPFSMQRNQPFSQKQII